MLRILSLNDLLKHCTWQLAAADSSIVRETRQLVNVKWTTVDSKMSIGRRQVANGTNRHPVTYVGRSKGLGYKLRPKNLQVGPKYSVFIFWPPRVWLWYSALWEESLNPHRRACVPATRPFDKSPTPTDITSWHFSRATYSVFCFVFRIRLIMRYYRLTMYVCITKLKVSNFKLINE